MLGLWLRRSAIVPLSFKIMIDIDNILLNDSVKEILKERTVIVW